MSNVAKKLVEDYLNQYDIDREQIYLINSIGLDKNINFEMEKLVKSNGFKNITQMEAGAMISSHSGPGGFGIVGLEV